MKTKLICAVCDRKAEILSTRAMCDFCEQEFAQLKFKAATCEGCKTPISCLTRKECLDANPAPTQMMLFVPEW